MDDLQVIKKARDLVADHWTTHMWAIDDPELGMCYCAAGALSAARIGDEPEPNEVEADVRFVGPLCKKLVLEAFHDGEDLPLARNGFGHDWLSLVTHYNDELGVAGHGRVLEMFDRAIAHMEAS